MLMQKYKEFLREASLSRVHTHLKSDRSIGIISAFREDEYTYEENVQRNRELSLILRKAGYGYFWVDGAWIENEGTKNEVHVSEVSIFVIGDEKDNGKLKTLLTDMAYKYNQDAFVYKDGNTNKIEVIDKYGKIKTILTTIKMDKIASLYTRFKKGNHKGRSFVFENERFEKNWAARFIK
jgi:hypothetical protein